MVEVRYIDGDTYTFETKNSIYSPWKWLKDEQSYLIPSIDGDVVIPAGFVKYIRHIETK